MSNQTQRILVAEDNPVMGNVLRFNLERAGYRVDLIHHGAKAFERFNQETFDLVIADYQMPGMNGEQLCRAIRQGSWNSSVPALLITAKRFELNVQELSRELGLSQILAKPFSPREVVETARLALDSPHPVAPTHCPV